SCVKQRSHRNSPPRIRLRIFLLEINRDCIEISHRLRDGHTRFQPPERPKTLVVIAIPHPWFVCDLAQRKQYIWISAKLQFRPKYADDPARQSTDQHAPAKHGWRTSEMMSPQAFANQRDIRRARCVICRA